MELVGVKEVTTRADAICSKPYKIVSSLRIFKLTITKLQNANGFHQQRNFHQQTQIHAHTSKKSNPMPMQNKFADKKLPSFNATIQTQTIAVKLEAHASILL